MSFDTQNTRLAACLRALGHKQLEIEPQSIGNGWVAIVKFIDLGELATLNALWNGFKNGSEGDHVLFEQMKKTAKARDWIVTRVVHGSHNESLEMPSQSFWTEDLKFAICLVSLDYYLFKLDKETRRFHFTSLAAKELCHFKEPIADSEMEASKKYLAEYDLLSREIKKVIDRASGRVEPCHVNG